jgi:hypothetical protein
MRLRIGLFWTAVAMALVASSPALGECDTYPWIVTGSDVPGGVVVNVCGLWVGCTPQNPQVSVSGDQVHITFTAGELPGCQCIQVQFPFNQNVFVPSLPAGTYIVTTTVVTCGRPQDVGTGSIVSGAFAAVPTLDRRGMTAFALLLGAFALWKLRG